MVRFFIGMISLLSLVNSCYVQNENPEIIKRKLLITGCARSGTRYISQLLQNSGYDIKHELIGSMGTSSWVMVVPAKTTPWGPARDNLTFEHIFHQVRDPLKVISSVYTTEGVKSWGFIMSHIPEIKEEDSYIVRSAKYWYYWNLKADALAEWTYRIEDLDNVKEEFNKRLNIKISEAALSMINKDDNARAMKPAPRGNNVLKQDFTWDDLKLELDAKLFSDIQDLARKYGYL